jgi:hypothetical protein
MTGRLLILAMMLGCVGCGTTRQTDSARAATEMLLVSQAVDEAVEQMDFSALVDKAVFVKSDFVDNSLVDRGYLISTVRQQLLAAGALLKEDIKDSTYVVELRTGGLGTDRHTLLVGSPQLSLPAMVPGMPTNIPELALVKRTEQKGVAKIGVFAYNRITGRAVWQSGLQEGESTLKDRWVFGAGPFTRGSIKRNTEWAGEPLPKLPIPNPFGSEKVEEPMPSKPVTPGESHVWANADVPPPPQPVPVGLTAVTGVAPVVGRTILQ